MPLTVAGHRYAGTGAAAENAGDGVVADLIAEVVAEVADLIAEVVAEVVFDPAAGS